MPNKYLADIEAGARLNLSSSVISLPACITLHVTRPIPNCVLKATLNTYRHECTKLLDAGIISPSQLELRIIIDTILWLASADYGIAVTNTCYNTQGEPVAHCIKDHLNEPFVITENYLRLTSSAYYQHWIGAVENVKSWFGPVSTTDPSVFVKDAPFFSERDAAELEVCYDPTVFVGEIALTDLPDWFIEITMPTPGVYRAIADCTISTDRSKIRSAM